MAVPINWCATAWPGSHDVSSHKTVARIVGSRWMTEDFMLLLKLPS